MTTVLVIGLLVFAAGWFLYSNEKLTRRLRSKFKREKNDLADKFGNLSTDYDDALVQAEKQQEQFVAAVAEAKAELKINQGKYDDLIRSVDKWNVIAQKEAEEGNRDNVEQAIKQKRRCEEQAKILADLLEDGVVHIEKLHSQLDSQRNQIEDAEFNAAIVKARQASLDVRKRMNATESLFNEGSLKSLKSLAEELSREEAKMDAVDELSGTPVQDLERKHMHDSSVDDEVEALLSKVKK